MKYKVEVGYSDFSYYIAMPFLDSNSLPIAIKKTIFQLRCNGYPDKLKFRISSDIGHAYVRVTYINDKKYVTYRWCDNMVHARYFEEVKR